MANQANGNTNPVEELLRSRARSIDFGVQTSDLAPLLGPGVPSTTGVPIERIEQIIAQAAGVNDGNPTRAITEDTRAAREEGLNDTIAPDYLQTRADRRPLNVIARELREGAFQGVSEQYLREQLNDIVQRGNGSITYAMAGKILERSQTQRESSWLLDSFLGVPSSWRGGTDLGGGRQVDSSRVAAYIDEIKNGSVHQNVEQAAQRESVVARLEAAQTNYQAAAAELADAERRLQNGDYRAEKVIPRLRQRVQELAIGLALTQAEVSGNSQNVRSSRVEERNFPTSGGVQTGNGVFSITGAPASGRGERSPDNMIDWARWSRQR